MINSFNTFYEVYFMAKVRFYQWLFARIVVVN